MSTLLLKLNATGDVVRTTSLLNCLPGTVTWVTATHNVELLEGAHPCVRCLSWEERESATGRSYDLVVNLEDDADVAAFAETVGAKRRFGARADGQGNVTYTADSRGWFDLSLISTFGRARADELKLQNRRTYQQLVFEGLGWQFADNPYHLPRPIETGLRGDVAVAPVAGPVWPMKGWAYYGELEQALKSAGYMVNVLPRRNRLLEHLGDVAGHRCLLSGDSLPMHLALGLGVPCVTLFNCTSPWEIHDYGIQTKLVSPLLEQFFYRRGFDLAATTAIRLEDVFDAVVRRLRDAPPSAIADTTAVLG